MSCCVLSNIMISFQYLIMTEFSRIFSIRKINLEWFWRAGLLWRKRYVLPAYQSYWQCCCTFQVAELRGLARECMKTDRSTEAFLHLSHALRYKRNTSISIWILNWKSRLDEDNRDLLVERSRVCSGEACQYHFAMEVIELLASPNLEYKLA